MSQQDNSAATPLAYLLGMTGALANSRFTIEVERVTIGRDPSQCQIVLDHPMISKRHALIEFTGQQAAIIDLDSRNGTFVNGQRITRRDINDSDIIAFGPGATVVLTFRKASKSIPSVAAPQANNVSVGHQFKSPSGQVVPPAADPRPAMRAPTENAPQSVAVTMFRIGDKPLVRIGRAPDNDVILDVPGVSRYHATLTYGSGPQPVITDIGSTNGTFVNGEPLSDVRLLNPNDLISIGGFLLRIEGRQIRRVDLSVSRISAWGVAKVIDGKTIIKDISLALWPREFVGLMGPSGCGKSTLMDTLNGLRPATSGAVFVNELDLYRNFDALRRSIGHVPQKDILHDSLTVERTLYYAGKLRLPIGTPAEQINRVVAETIASVGLVEQRDTKFSQLSGGQQKRLSLAIELITKPSFIFLDEPTSPLDPETTENMMDLFRRLADEGRIVVMVTHRFEKFEQMHHVAILTKGGRLAFFGPPHEALQYFGCNQPTEIYRRVGSRNPEELSNAFKQSPQYQHYVASRITEAQAVVRGKSARQALGLQRGTEREFGISQWVTLTRRYLDVKLKDLRNTALLLMQAPLIAILLALISGNSINEAKTLFFASVISIWFGANNAIREIVAEFPIYRRERLVNLKIPSYVFSKFTVLGGVALIQCLMLVTIIVAFGRLNSADFIILMLILYLTSLAGINMGLFFSALVKSTEKAMTVLPLILIPQILLGGMFMPIDDVYINRTLNKPATAAEYERFKSTSPQSSPGATNAQAIPGQTITKTAGMGAGAIATIPIIARWSFDALNHAVSIDNPKNKDGFETRDVLAMTVYVPAYENVLENKSASQITNSYTMHVLLDVFMLVVFIFAFLGLTMWALKRKDVL